MIEAESKDLVEVTRCKNCSFCRLDTFNESILTTRNKIHIGCAVHISRSLDIIPTNPDGYCYLGIPATKGCSLVDVLRDTFTKHQDFIKQLDSKDISKDMEFVLSDDYVDTQLTRLYKSLND